MWVIELTIDGSHGYLAARHPLPHGPRWFTRDLARAERFLEEGSAWGAFRGWVDRHFGHYTALDPVGQFDPWAVRIGPAQQELSGE